MFPALLLAASLSAGTAPEPSSTLSQFSFRPGAVPVGEVFHFRKSNLDGSRPAMVSVYVLDAARLDVLKAEDVGRRLARIQARIDWNSFSVDELVSWNRLETGRPVRQAAFRLDPASREVEVQVGNASARVRASALPVALYNFDLLGLAAAWPHLVRPGEKVQVDLVDPDWEFMKTRFRPEGEQPGLLVDRGLATFTPDGEEEHGGVPCRRYTVAGPAFGGRAGTLWAEARSGQWVEFRHPVPDNPAWTSFRLELVGWEALDPDEWDAFVEGRIRRATDLLREFGDD